MLIAVTKISKCVRCVSISDGLKNSIMDECILDLQREREREREGGGGGGRERERAAERKTIKYADVLARARSAGYNG